MPPSIDTGETEKKVVSTAEELPVNSTPLHETFIVTDLEKDSKADQALKQVEVKDEEDEITTQPINEEQCHNEIKLEDGKTDETVVLPPSSLNPEAAPFIPFPVEDRNTDETLKGEKADEKMAEKVQKEKSNPAEIEGEVKQAPEKVHEEEKKGKQF